MKEQEIKIEKKDLFDINKSFICPYCKKETVYNYLSSKFISGMYETGDFICIKCKRVFRAK